MATTRRGPVESTTEIQARVHATRIERLRKLIDLEFDGVVSKLIMATEVSEKRSRSSYISQMQSGHRPFGEMAARQIEVDCGKPAGWLDGSTDGELTKKENASAKRVEVFKAFLAEEYGSSLDKLFAARNRIGTRRRQFLRDLLQGTRFISKETASLVEKECGLTEGYLG